MACGQSWSHVTFTLTFQRASLLNDKPALPLWVKSWSATPGANIPCNAVSNRPYSGWNVVLLWMTQAAGYRTPRFLTVRQALELGGHVPADLVGDDISKKP